MAKLFGDWRYMMNLNEYFKFTTSQGPQPFVVPLPIFSCFPSFSHVFPMFLCAKLPERPVGAGGSTMVGGLQGMQLGPTARPGFAPSRFQLTQRPAAPAPAEQPQAGYGRMGEAWKKCGRCVEDVWKLNLTFRV